MTVIGVIYAITHRASGRAYIGSTIDERGRFIDHLWYLRRRRHHCRHLQHAWCRYGQNAFVWSILERPEVDTGRELIAAERKWMLAVGNLFNAIIPSESDDRVLRHSAQTRAIMSQVHKARGSRPPPEAMAKALAWSRGREVSASTRAALRQALLGKKHEPAVIAKRTASIRAWNAVPANRSIRLTTLAIARAAIGPDVIKKRWIARRIKLRDAQHQAGQLSLHLESRP